MKLIKSLAIATVAAALAPFVHAAPPFSYGARFDYSGVLVGAGPGGTDLSVSGFVYDKDIHSGVSRDVHASPSGLGGAPLFSDAWVLQGGDPYGGDTGDAFEVTQADGHFSFGSMFDVTTHYAFGQPSSQVGTFITAGPDTGSLNFKNNTAYAFKGTLELSGHAAGGIYGPEQDFSNSGSTVIAPGDSANIVLNYESSNFGGYNHPDVPGANLPDGGATAGLLGLGLAALAGMRARARR